MDEISPIRCQGKRPRLWLCNAPLPPVPVLQHDVLFPRQELARTWASFILLLFPT